MELWYTEKQTDNVGITCKVNRTLHTETSPFQRIDVLETKQFGRMLLLDGLVMTTEKDEFVYHEMIAQVPLNTHPDPQRVLVIGGGDGGSLREVTRHPKVRQATLCEIDARVIEVCQEYFPAIANALRGNPKAEILVADGIAHIQERPHYYDVILIDSTDPIGAAEGLFTLDFYRQVYKSLKEDGIMAAQTESPFYDLNLVRKIYKNIEQVFPVTKLYLASIPTYPSGLWSFTLGSKRYDPEQVKEADIPDMPMQYYTAQIHKAAFNLPKFIDDALKTL
ncbi:MAG: polyamine aminopropyltransferase [Peptococcaceae bacterium]|jgi:spermidine synthase|nr:polyamine aminopropyltransferase [Peptococcaceae bacterium]